MRRYVVNLVCLVMDRMLMMLFQLWFASFLTKQFGLNVFGSWSVVNNTFTLVYSVTILTVDLIVIKNIIEKQSNTGEYITAGIFVQLLGFVVGSAICYLIYIFGYFEYNEAIFLFCISFIISNLMIVLTKWFYWHYSALVESKYRSFSVILSVLISFILIKYVLLSYNDNLFFLSYSIYYLVQFFISLLVYLLFFKHGINISLNFSILKEYTTIGFKLIISTVCVSLFTQSDVIMLSILGSNSDAGVYSAAFRVSSIFFILAGIIGNVFYPKIVAMKDTSGMDDFLVLMMSMVVSFSIFVSIFISIFSDVILSFLYGKVSAEIAAVLTLHIWSCIFIYIGSFSSKWLYANSYYDIEIKKTLIAASVNILLNLIAIPFFGPTGAAVTSLIAYCIANHIVFYFSNKTKHLFNVQNAAFKNAINPFFIYRGFKRIKCLFL